jgi:hypothetical protein
MPNELEQLKGAGTAGDPILDSAEVKQLRTFEQLPPNWNSYGAEPISRDTVDAAINLLMHVMGKSGVRPDFLAPVATGGIQLEWFGTDAEIDVRVNPRTSFDYLYVEGDEHVERHNVPLQEVVDAVAKTLRT